VIKGTTTMSGDVRSKGAKREAQAEWCDWKVAVAAPRIIKSGHKPKQSFCCTAMRDLAAA